MHCCDARASRMTKSRERHALASTLVWCRLAPNKSDKLMVAEREAMNLGRILFSFTLTAAASVLTLAAPSRAQQPAAVAIDNDDIGGVVAGPNGPEAGVWVIAET